MLSNGADFFRYDFQVQNDLSSRRHTDRFNSQLSQVIPKNYSTAPRVPIDTWGLVCDPRLFSVMAWTTHKVAVY